MNYADLKEKAKPRPNDQEEKSYIEASIVLSIIAITMLTICFVVPFVLYEGPTPL